MTWHLKDRELEKKLNDISSGDFSKQLNEVKNLASYKEGLYLVFGNVGDFRKYKIFIEYNELEEVPEYNPNKWNEYPAVTPPEGVVMRVISICGQSADRECAIFDEGAWKNERDGKPTHLLLSEVKRFRPWED